MNYKSYAVFEVLNNSNNWTNVSKIKAFLDYMKKIEHKYVVLADAYDVIVQCYPKECIDYIENITRSNQDSKIIIGDGAKYKTPDIFIYT